MYTRVTDMSLFAQCRSRANCRDVHVHVLITQHDFFFSTTNFAYAIRFKLNNKLNR